MKMDGKIRFATHPLECPQEIVQATLASLQHAHGLQPGDFVFSDLDDNADLALRRVTEVPAAMPIGLMFAAVLRREEIVSGDVPVPGERTFAIITHKDNARAHKLAACLHDKATAVALQSERAFQLKMETLTDCNIRALASVEGARVFLQTQAFTRDGKYRFEHEANGLAKDAVNMGIEAALALLRAGGALLAKQG